MGVCHHRLNVDVLHDLVLELGSVHAALVTLGARKERSHRAGEHRLVVRLVVDRDAAVGKRLDVPVRVDVPADLGELAGAHNLGVVPRNVDDREVVRQAGDEQLVAHRDDLERLVLDVGVRVLGAAGADLGLDQLEDVVFQVKRPNVTTCNGDTKRANVHGDIGHCPKHLVVLERRHAVLVRLDHNAVADLKRRLVTVVVVDGVGRGQEGVHR